MRYRAAHASLVLSCAMFATVAGAQDDAGSPLIQHRAQHPLNAVFGLPAVASRRVSGRGEWQLSIEHANSFMGGVRGEEVLLLDGESSELVLRHRRRLGRCWQVEAVLPMVSHTGGWADRAIDDWHHLFELPDAERDRYAPFELRYLWTDADGRRRELDESTAGIGDMQFAAQRPLTCGHASAVAAGRGPRADTIARFGVKVPSGDPDRLLGSGALDLYADLQSPILSLGTRWRFGATVGVLLPGRSELFAAPRALALFGSLGTSLRLHERWRALAQIDWHTPFHDSELRELGAFAADLVIGLRHRLSPTWQLELSVAEDAIIDTSPDIVGRIAWTWRPR